MRTRPFGKHMHINELPPAAGIGLKAQHYQGLLDDPSSVAWLEIHPENYMGAGGPPHRYLTALSEHFPLSMHGVGMSLGSADGIDAQHLQRLKTLVERYQPVSVSEHLSWSHWNSVFLNDLLPLPYTHESLDIVCSNIDKVQETLGRRILIENPSTYIDFAHSDYTETEFFKQIVTRCDCRLLLDINNVFVSGSNNQFDPYLYLENYPRNFVQEIHLAGHSVQSLTNGNKIRIDDHGSEVQDEVWRLYEYFFTLEQRAIATLIEWDSQIPELATLLAQAQKAQTVMQNALTKQCTGVTP